MGKRRKVEPPPHYNPLPNFGLVLKLSRTAQAIVYFARRAGAEGVSVDRMAALLYMGDVHAREYLGHPITDIEWRADHFPPTESTTP